VQTHFDYIIIGAGLSGYTMALRMSQDSFFEHKTIALIDPNFSKKNDRTWCFWETTPDFFESVVSHQWENILVKGNQLQQPIAIAPYSYKKIESEDFYAFAKAQLSQYSNITLIQHSVVHLKDTTPTITVTTNQKTYTAQKVLDSRYNPTLLTTQKQAIVLQQHFVGWFIKTSKNVFDPEVASYMDFSVPQNGNCRFMYVLPTSKTEALLEYTLFSKDLLSLAEYENAIKDYLKELGVVEYEIVSKERGSIPMTTYDFTKHNTENTIHIGTAGGWTKASTGYTFKHTLKKSEQLISFIKSGKSFTQYTLKNKWNFYDAVLLQVLSSHNNRGKEIFTRMFKKRKAAHIFKFLDEESSFKDELKVILSAPKWLFIKAALKVIFGR